MRQLVMLMFMLLLLNGCIQHHAKPMETTLQEAATETRTQTDPKRALINQDLIHAGKRTALIIGNSAYTGGFGASFLKNRNFSLFTGKPKKVALQ